MKNLSLSMKMSVIFAVLIVVSLVIAAVGINRLYYINEHVDEVVGLSEKLALTSKIYEKAIWCVRVEKNIIFAPSMEKKGEWEAKFNNYVGEMKDSEKELDALLSEEAKKMLREYDEKWAAYEANARKIIELSKTYGGIQLADGSATLEQRKNFIRAADLSQVTGRKIIDEMEGSLNGLRDRYKGQVKQAEADSEKALTSTLWLLIIVSSIGILSGLALAVIILRSVTKNLGGVMEGLSEGSGQVHGASGQLSETSQQMAEGASEQAASIEETSSSLEEISSMTKHNADNSNAVSNLMSETKRGVDKGSGQMKELVTAMGDIKKASDDIAKIIKVIEEIAFQTNLLALNAAVEAARAGEHGKGFAVVAEEVRNLAQRAGTASKDIAQLIQNAVSKADSGNEITVQVAKSLEEIATGIKKAGDLAAEVAAASVEQAQGVEQINKAITQMDSVTQQNAANAEEAASSSEELSAQAELLNSHVQELTAVIFGGEHGTHAPAVAPARKPAPAARPAAKPMGKPMAKPKGLPAPRKPAPAPASKGPRSVKAEEVIPFDDDDFKEF